jgi:hypothetical protein
MLLLLIVVAGVAGYFTKPSEAAMRAGADAELSQGDLIDQVGGAVVSAVGDRTYSDYKVGAKYTVASPLDGNVLVECWGGFTQVMCNRVADADAQAS